MRSHRMARACVVFALVLIGVAAGAKAVLAQSNTQTYFSRAMAEFLHRYGMWDFGKAIRLGSNRLPSELLKLTIEFDPDYANPGKYFPAEATWSRKSYMKIKSGDMTDWPSAKTLWHESMHHLVALSGGAPCGQEESYMYLNEDRLDWLEGVNRFERNYNSGTVSNRALKLEWKALEARWANNNRDKRPVAAIGGPATQALSGPYWQQDADDTCGEGRGKWTRVDPGFVQHWDRILGIDIDPKKIKAVYRGLEMPDVIQGKMRVRVLHADTAEPIAGAKVTISGSSKWSFTGTSTKEGTVFNLPVTEGVPEDIARYIRYSVSASRSGYESATSSAKSLSPEPAAPLDVVIRLHETGFDHWPGVWTTGSPYFYEFKISPPQGGTLKAEIEAHFKDGPAHRDVGTYTGKVTGHQWSGTWESKYADTQKSGKRCGSFTLTFARGTAPAYDKISGTAIEKCDAMVKAAPGTSMKPDQRWPVTLTRK